jgi:hypothetical protein
MRVVMTFLRPGEPARVLQHDARQSGMESLAGQQRRLLRLVCAVYITRRAVLIFG